MELTQAQISEIVYEKASTEQGLHELITLLLNSLLKHERTLWQEENKEAANGFRARCVRYHGMEFALQIPRTRQGGFYPTLLAVLRDEDQEKAMLFNELYTKGLTCEQIGQISERIYSRTYSKQQISYLVREAGKDVDAWLSRRLSPYYPVVYIDATYVSTRREHSVSQETYYSMLGVLPDGKREVLGIVNHPTEGAINWKTELNVLRERGVEKIDLIVSDALSGIENAVTGAFPTSRHQFCVVHLLREMRKLVPRKDVAMLCEEFHKVLSLDRGDVTSASQYEEFLKFAARWSAKNPRFGRYCKEKRNAMYFTFLDYAPKFHRMIYTTNWIERLNRSYKRTLSMRGAMPSASSVLFLLGSVAMEMTKTTYSYPVSLFEDWTSTKQKASTPSPHSSSNGAKESPLLLEE